MLEKLRTEVNTLGNTCKQNTKYSETRNSKVAKILFQIVTTEDEDIMGYQIPNAKREHSCIGCSPKSKSKNTFIQFHG